MIDSTKRWQAFIQLVQLAPDGVTQWHSLNRPAPTMQLARRAAETYLYSQYLALLCDVESPVFTANTLSQYISDRQITIAIIEVDAHSKQWCRADIPADAVTLTELWPPMFSLPALGAAP